MKKFMLIIFFITLGLMLSLGVHAQNYGENKDNSSKNSDYKIENKTQYENNSNHNESGQGSNNETNNSRGIGQELSAQIRELKGELKEGNYTGSLGQLLNVKQLSSDLRELRVKNVSAETNLNVTREQINERTKLTVKLNNGKEKEIKIMPDTASERALESLKLNSCSSENNCTIVLKETGVGTKDNSIKYEIQIERHAKLLGLFRIKIAERAEVDAESGDTKVKKPWWAFLAVETE
ncbi:MAG: hypothetical protein V1660_02265 [archaeon]